jgi:hypothetical protein
MKSKTYIILLLLVSCFSSAQTIEKLKAETKKIHDANYTMDFETITNLTYPKVVSNYWQRKIPRKIGYRLPKRSLPHALAIGESGFSIW